MCKYFGIVAETLCLYDDWTYKNISDISKSLKSIPDNLKLLDATQAKDIDTSGMILIIDLIEHLHISGSVVKFNDNQKNLYNIVKKHKKDTQPKQENIGFIGKFLSNIYNRMYELYLFINFLGLISLDFAGIIAHPKKRLRWRAIVKGIETMGYNALPIIGVISFLIGAVIAYQGSVQLSRFGVNIFVVDLVSISIVRELGPLLVAIILAGRSASSYTSQIGIMKVTQEIYVLDTMGIRPYDILVFPKIISLVIAMPFLIVFSDILGIFGGMVVSQISLGVSIGDFFRRLNQIMTLKLFLSGIIKGPVFAVLIAAIGSFKGFRTQTNVESIGKNVTISVVDSIFSVIVADAIFSILFRWAGI